MPPTRLLRRRDDELQASAFHSQQRSGWGVPPVVADDRGRPPSIKA
jgi:hypothetical protein